MTEEEKLAAISEMGKQAAEKAKEVTAQVTKKLEDLEKGIISKADFEAFKSEQETELSKLRDAMKEQGRELGTLKATEKPQSNNMTLEGALFKAFEPLKEQLAEIHKNGGKQKDSIHVEVTKAAIDMGTDNTIGSGSTQYTLTQNTGVISPIRRRAEKYLAAVSTGSISGSRALWVEETDEQGTPIFIGEGDGKTKISSKWIEKTAEVRKIAVYGKVTSEMMADLPQLISYIQNSLIKRVSVKTESELLTGDNVGDNLNGAKTLATAFSAGANANAIDEANEFDVLDAIALQVEVANGSANAVFIHPATWAKMKSLKDLNGAPIWKNYLMPNGEVVYSGMQIITTTAVTAGEFIGGDMTVLNVLFKEQLNIQIGLDGNDFTNNKKTILVEQRLVQYASANDTPCIVKGDFATAKTALETA
jgi:HK97 family phage major capsid protein